MGQAGSGAIRINPQLFKMAHEKTITVEMGGRYLVIPSVIDGVEDADAAIKKLRAGKLRPFGQFSTDIQADEYARNRSLKSKMTHSHD